MKKVFYITIIGIQCILLCACSVISTKKHLTDYNKYGKYDGTVNDLIEEFGRVILPDAMPDGAINAVYDYFYQNAVLGDPSFCIYLKVDFETAVKHENELQRVKDASSMTVECSNGNMIYLSEEIKSVKDYFDDAVLDGLTHIIDAAVICTDNSIEYYYIYWQDNAARSNAYVDSIMHLINDNIVCDN